jgi:hypothetical protein
MHNFVFPSNVALLQLLWCSQSGWKAGLGNHRSRRSPDGQGRPSSHFFNVFRSLQMQRSALNEETRCVESGL